MINIAIVEDEKNISQELENFVKEIFEKNNFDICISCFENAKSFIDQFSSSYDLIFMDINMPIMDGMTAAREIRKKDDKVMIVFVTSLAQYAIKGYEVNAFDFILKPITYASFYLKFARIMQKVNEGNDSPLVIKGKQFSKRIDPKQIFYIEISDHDLVYHTSEGNIKGHGSMRILANNLKKSNFVLCNQSYLVNLAYIKEISNGQVRVDNDWLIISRPKKREFLKSVDEFFSSKNKAIKED